MGDLWRIVIGAGLQDGFNPCTLMTCAIFIVHGIWAQKSVSRLGFLRLFFVLTYVLGAFFFNFGPMGTFLFQKTFVSSVRIIYFGFGMGSFVLGILFLRDWFLLRRRVPEGLTAKKAAAPASVIGAWLVTIILGVVLSALATLWPINYYMVLLGTGALLKGQWQAVLLLLAGYTIVSMWPLWFLWSFLSIKNLRPTLVRIVCAAVFFAASSSMILIFK